MSTFPDPSRPPAPVVPPPPLNGRGVEPSAYHACDDCGSPLDDRQRYCVVCGSRRKHADDPAARFLAAATRRRRASSAAPAVARRRSGAASLATAVGIAAIPLALGGGVLIGRSSAGGDGKLIAALHNEKAPVIRYSGGGATSPVASSAPHTTSSATPVVNTFTASRGWVVQLGAIPASGGPAAVGRAERADRARGAARLGVIAGSGHALSPAPPAGDVVIYAGSYPTRARAIAAMAKLAHRFPAAKVVRVSAPSAASTGGGGHVIASTKYGKATQAAGYKPSRQALSQGASVAAKDSHATGTTASGAGLPSVVSVP